MKLFRYARVLIHHRVCHLQTCQGERHHSEWEASKALSFKGDYADGGKFFSLLTDKQVGGMFIICILASPKSSEAEVWR
eukprot:766720-Hanusia_phi.AAC.5